MPPNIGQCISKLNKNQWENPFEDEKKDTNAKSVSHWEWEEKYWLLLPLTASNKYTEQMCVYFLPHMVKMCRLLAHNEVLACTMCHQIIGYDERLKVVRTVYRILLKWHRKYKRDGYKMKVIKNRKWEKASMEKTRSKFIFDETL